jgi:hypothetical protein
MQSRRSGSAGTFLNPTILAMVGSVGAHGILVLISALHPAEGQQNTLQVVSIAPQGSATKVQKPGTLSVPNELPPINLGKIPQLPAAPDISIAKIPPSQSSYMGSPSKAIGKLPIYNVPIQSFPGSAVPNVGQSGIPNSILGGVGPFGSTGSTFGGAGSTGNSRAGSTPNRGYEALPSPVLPKFPQSSGNDLSTPNSGASATNPVAMDTISAQARKKYKDSVNLQSQRYGQKLSAQIGPWLRADYPPQACASRQNGFAAVSGLYGPDGIIVSSDDAVQVLQASDPVFEQAAIAEVTRYRANAAGIYQSISFKVDVPYSSSVCLSAQPKSSPTSTPKTDSTASPSPSGQPTQTSSPQISPQISPEPSPQGQPLVPPKTVPITPEPSSISPAPVQSSAPESSTPAPTGGASPSPAPDSPSLEPLPAPSIAPTEPTKP